MKDSDEVASLQGEVTQLLRQWSEGSEEALQQLLPTVYDELRRMAARRLRRERDDHTLQPTALVHEAYLRLAEQCKVHWQDRAHFFAIAARIMRRVLVDHARRANAAKRVSAGQKVPLELAPPVATLPNLDLLDLDRTLQRLAELDQRQAEIVELRFFGGLTVEEVARVLGISEATVAREWRMARVWLYRELQGGETGQQQGP